MNLDPNRSREDWRRLLESEAATAWGAERAAELQPMLARAAEALWRTARREPRPETVPWQPPSAG